MARNRKGLNIEVNGAPSTATVHPKPEDAHSAFRIKADNPYRLCRLMVHGKGCRKKAFQRGLCRPHWAYCQQHGLLDTYGLPKRSVLSFELKSSPRPGTCRVVVNGTGCERKSQFRGLCKVHYNNIRRREDLNLDDYALPVEGPVPIRERLRKNVRPKANRCIIIDGGVPCTRKAYLRGICNKHYDALKHAGESFDDWGLPNKHREMKIDYSVNAHPKPGTCRIIQTVLYNGKIERTPCRSEVRGRGLCRNHHGILSRKGLLEEFALPLEKRKKKVFRKKSDSDIVGGVCVIIEDDVPCKRKTTPAKGMICHKHRQAITRRKDLNIKDFIHRLRDLYEIRQAPSGVCCIVEDGMPCDREDFATGMCQTHYSTIRARDKRLLKSLARKVAKRALPGIRVYVDKNIVIHCLAHNVFGVSTHTYSRRLIDAILRGKIDGTVSVNCVTASYSYLRLRLVRPKSESGMDLSEEEAHERAEEAVAKLFFSENSPWRFVPYETSILRAREAGLTWEDSMEWSAFQKAREWKVGPEVFVTQDADFEEGVLPQVILERLRKHDMEMALSSRLPR